MSLRWMAAVAAAMTMFTACDFGGEDPGNEAGAGGDPGEAGSGGDPGEAGSGGDPGEAGSGGDPGEAGSGGDPGEAGSGGDPGEGGTGGDPGEGGTGGDPGEAGSGGDPGEGGSGGDPGEGGTGGTEPPPYECGDGTLHNGESCDDGNRANGDGCDEWCRIEAPAPGETIRVSGSVTRDDWTWARPDLDCETPMNGEYFRDEIRVVNTGDRAITINGEVALSASAMFFGIAEEFVSTDPYGECSVGAGHFGRESVSVIRVMPGMEALLIITARDANAEAGAWTLDITVGTCGDELLDEGEQCDDGNLWNEDGCSATRRWEPQLEREVNDDIRWPDAIPTFGPVQGTLSATDVDLYLTVGFRSITYTASIYRGDYGKCLDTAPTLELLDEDGNLLQTAAATNGACAALDFTTSGPFPEVFVLRVTEGTNAPTAPLVPYFLHVTY